MSRQAALNALDQLENLLPGQFEKVCFHYGMPPALLPSGSQTEQAIALIRYAQQQKEPALENLLAVINRVVSPGKDKNARDGLHLPWLPDRSEQKTPLRAVMKAYHQHYTGQAMPPLLCVIHGKDCEHAHLREHLQHFLEEKAPQFKCAQEYDLKLGGQTLRNARELRAALDEALNFAEFEQFQRNGRQAAVVYGSLYPNDCFGANQPAWLPKLWGRQEADWLSVLAEFWGGFQGNVPCLVLVCVQYPSHTGNDAPARRVNAQLAALETLDVAAFAARFGLPGVVLPSLQAVSLEAVYRWTDDHKHIIPEHWGDIEWLRQRIEQFYREHAPDGRLCMGKLGLQLKQWMKASA